LNALRFRSGAMHLERKDLIGCSAPRDGITDCNDASENQAEPERNSKQFQIPLATPHAWPTPERFAA
jgi:hypothetical protein